MGTVAQKHLDWIERAPVSFSGSVTTTASPQAVFAILADHERWPDWFPLLKKPPPPPPPPPLGARPAACVHRHRG